MNTNNNIGHRYRLIAINRNDELIFEISNQPLRIRRTAREALADHKLLNNLPPTHVALIGYIAGMNIN